ncbi:MAG: N-acetyl-gamma-glutamyl-phosphate reductase [Ruminococcaceae bacterium]|nr:N-acetyl-gamma-glutamyl-phosphate reductase [Oscillospiraceae bacterium]
MKPKVYIDGKEGTTGLQIYDRLASRSDIELLLIDEDKRKDPAERKKLMDAADIVFLCLPDAAAIEAVGLVESESTRIIDASTAHRTNPAWAYGFPELSADHRAAIAASKRVANPGCHASGFVSIVYPMVAMGILPADAALSCFSLTGYSGGGKKMIADYESDAKTAAMSSPGIYATAQAHKHLPEMQVICGLESKPVFCPIVDDYYKGMATTVTFHMSQLQGVSTVQEVRDRLAAHYAGQKMVTVSEGTSSGSLYGGAQAGSDCMTIVVAGNDERFTVTALFDNLGKGASGAAVQNMNIMLGLDETTSLSV